MGGMHSHGQPIKMAGRQDGSTNEQLCISVNQVRAKEMTIRLRSQVRVTVRVHTAQDSLLSNASGFNNYRGFLNLCIVLLAMSSGRLVLENLLKYGILVDPVSWASVLWNDPYRWPNVTLAICINYFILFSFVVEKLTTKLHLSENLFDFLSMGNLVVLLLFPVIVITVVEPNPVGACFALGMYAMAAMKLYSYHVVNQWCRQAIGESKKRKKSLKKTPPSSPKKETNQKTDLEKPKDSSTENGDALHVSETVQQEYPQNINLKDIYYFMLAPTLCYELNFPRTERIRKRFLIRRIVELVFLLQLSLCLIQQWIVPLVYNAMKPFSEMDVTRMVERILKLAVSFFFQISLKLKLKFPTSNSPFIAYCDVVSRVNTKQVKTNVIRDYGNDSQEFRNSRLFLEELEHTSPQVGKKYLVSVPLHMFKLWAFMGMIMQIPLAYVVSMFFTRHYANMAVWLSIIIGQPVAVLMYVHDYYVINFVTTNESSINSTAT
ncbi:putative diacylglycerol O-acyltransferase 1 [Apostichopus japonicus]|uniref:O-acyltransferase n=1 Tax=Stichopus japonicus TaxID=307972 RepID=A0A2G8K8B6_STIJA|nr:putative diacylglycerol O-acyltransferase 1 [Apostichopus japonicus]